MGYTCILAEVNARKRSSSTPCKSKEWQTIKTEGGSPGPAGRTLIASSYCWEMRLYVIEECFSRYVEEISKVTMSITQIANKTFAQAQAVDLEPEVVRRIEIVPQGKC